MYNVYVHTGDMWLLCLYNAQGSASCDGEPNMKLILQLYNVLVHKIDVHM